MPSASGIERVPVEPGERRIGQRGLGRRGHVFGHAVGPGGHDDERSAGRRWSSAARRADRPPTWLAGAWPAAAAAATAASVTEQPGRQRSNCIRCAAVHGRQVLAWRVRLARGRSRGSRQNSKLAARSFMAWARPAERFGARAAVFPIGSVAFRPAARGPQPRRRGGGGSGRSRPSAGNGASIRSSPVPACA